MEIKKTFQAIPEVVLEKQKGPLKGSLKAVYMYAKLLMLHDKTYTRESWITNPISKKKEMSIDTMSFITGRLEMSDLIQINRLETGGDWPVNSYVIVPYGGYYKPVYNDFINHPELSADAKGLAILLSLLKSIPKSYSGIGRAIGIDGKTVKKYLTELENAGVYDRSNRSLSAEYFPYETQCQNKRYKSVIANYETALSTEASSPDMFQGRLKRQLDYVQRMDEPMAVKALVWRKAEMGLMGFHRPQIEDDEEYELINLN